MIERVSRNSVQFENNNRQSKPVMNENICALAPLPFEALRSITFDRGTVFAVWNDLKHGIGSDVWFCGPQAPWRQASVQSSNLKT